MIPEIIAALQAGLIAKGENPGAVDGEIGPRTIAAFDSYSNKTASAGRVAPERGMVRLAQEHLKNLGFDPGPVDGWDGPKTNAAALAWRRGKAQDALTNGPTLLVAEILRLCQMELASEIRENEGRNQGRGILKYWTATSYGPAGYKAREPYCAAGASWVIKTAAEKVGSPILLPNTAGAFDFDRWAREAGPAQVRYRLPVREAAAGDIFVMSISHVGFVIGRSGANLITWEANTMPGDGGNQRDGGGVYSRTRGTSGMRSIHRILI